MNPDAIHALAVLIALLGIVAGELGILAAAWGVLWLIVASRSSPWLAVVRPP